MFEWMKYSTYLNACPTSDQLLMFKIKPFEDRLSNIQVQNTG